ncbi:hypothetical protein [Photobacterium nomapromontoriensis]|uniref:hypothetical protein n=1 Tax=Photobacterium nomapromontoriensis TaxID=2910237 RepID=UPI003D136C22
MDETFSHYFAATGQRCYWCYADAFIHYGKGRNKTLRLQCKGCGLIFQQPALRPQQIHRVADIERYVLSAVPLPAVLCQGPTYGRSLEAAWQHATRQTVMDLALAPEPKILTTQYFSMPFQGAHALQHLFVLVTCDTASGKVVQYTTNYVQVEIGSDSLYIGSPAEPEMDTVSLAERVKQRELQFLKRSQFDELKYGEAQLKRNDKGCLIRPTIAAYNHFQLLALRYPNTATHGLHHDCFIRGACITAYHQQVREGGCHLYFIDEEVVHGLQPDGFKLWQYQGSHEVGWWRNRWREYHQRSEVELTQDNANQPARLQKVIGVLTAGEPDPIIDQLTLASNRAFERWLRTHLWYQRAATLSAKGVSQELALLVYAYNLQVIA